MVLRAPAERRGRGLQKESEVEHPFESLTKKERKSDAELIAFLAVTRISHQVPIGAALSLPASQVTPERVYDTLVCEASTLLDWYQNHIERRHRKRAVEKLTARDGD
jgi:hypothetical protein